MNRTSRCLRVTFLAALPVLLLAASWAPLLQSAGQFDSRQFGVNENRWRALSEASRQELRIKWQAFCKLPEAEREQYVQRMDILRRMTSTLRRILGREPRAEELDFQLDQTREPLHAWLTQELALDASVDDLSLRTTAEEVLAERIAGFLGQLVADGQLSSAESDRILAQPLSLVIRDAVGLHAAAQQRSGDSMAASGSGPAGSDFAGLLSRSEREALESGRSPSGRSVRDRDPGGGGDPLRLRLFKLAFVAQRFREAGMSEQEVQKAVMLPMAELEQLINEQLGLR